MRIGNLGGRAALISEAGAIDVHHASGGRFGPTLGGCYDAWADFVVWAAGCGAVPVAYDSASLGSPSPTPRQCYGIGMNYASHAAEMGGSPPEFPPTFTKFPSCLTGPFATVELQGDTIDYEVELVVVIGLHAHRVVAQDAWAHVAGLTVGQDLSDRTVQLRPPVPQFSLGKSFVGYGPMGPWLVSIDEFANPDDLALDCAINGETMQASRTSDLIFSVPQLIEKLSHITPLLPGDVIFTGTPSGVGAGRKPPRWLTINDELVSTIEGIGSITTRFTRSGDLS